MAPPLSTCAFATLATLALAAAAPAPALPALAAFAAFAAPVAAFAALAALAALAAPRAAGAAASVRAASSLSHVSNKVMVHATQCCSLSESHTLRAMLPGNHWSHLRKPQRASPSLTRNHYIQRFTTRLTAVADWIDWPSPSQDRVNGRRQAPRRHE